MTRKAERRFWLYILASKPRGVLYVGVTNDLVRRVWQHREGVVDGFTRKYFVRKLVYFEEHATAEAAIEREKKLKRWRRAWKVALIEKSNPYWHDLFEEIAA